MQLGGRLARPVSLGARVFGVIQALLENGEVISRRSRAAWTSDRSISGDGAEMLVRSKHSGLDLGEACPDFGGTVRCGFRPIIASVSCLEP